MGLTTNLNAVVGRNNLIASAEGQISGPSASVREIELKFLVSEAAFRNIQQSTRFGSGGGRAAVQRLYSVYFDTELGDLRRHRIVLRMRRLRSRHILTLKWDGKPGSGTFERGEMEVATASPVPDPAVLGAVVEAEIMRLTEGRPLQPFFTTDIRRVVRRVILGGSEIEAAFDTGSIVFGAQRTAVREIELELKAGDPADLYQFGLSLLTDFPMHLGVMTKAERGVLLSCGTHATAIRAVAPALTDQTTDQAIGAIISTCLSQFVDNWPAFDGPDKVEAIHQMRVALRRLRAALALFHRHFPCKEFDEFRAEAKRIATAMEKARNWDVFESLVRVGPHRAFPSDPGFEFLTQDVTMRREDGYTTVAALLAHTDTTRFVLSLEAFVARRGWRNALAGAELPRLTMPASGFASECLERLHRRVRKRGKALLTLPPEERHGVRIALKNLRYAADFFGNLFRQASVVRSVHASRRKAAGCAGQL